MANTKDKVLNIALNEVGYLEKKSNSQLDDKTANAGYNNYNKYARDLYKISGFYNGNKNGYAWCDCFVDWCFVQAYGVETAKKMLNHGQYGAGCSYSAQYFRNVNRFHTTPKIGDVIFFGTRGNESHTGIVYNVDNEHVYTVEGNTSSASGVVANGGGVFKKSYRINYNRISGYGRPTYDTSEQEYVPQAPTTNMSSSAATSQSNKIDTVKEVQNWANTNYNAGIVLDGIYGAKTKKALVKILQTELNQTYKSNLSVDGIWGNKTRAACPTLNNGSKNDVVGVLQALLICNGFSGAYLDKDYGSATMSAVKSYQKKKGLVVDGVAGKNTFAKLCG